MQHNHCATIEPLLLAWKSGELPLWTAVRVQMHVKRCAACTRELQALSRLDTTLRAMTPFGIEACSRQPNKPLLEPNKPLLGWSAVTLAFLLLVGGLALSGRFAVRKSSVESVAIIHKPTRPLSQSKKLTAIANVASPAKKHRVVSHVAHNRRHSALRRKLIAFSAVKPRRLPQHRSPTALPEEIILVAVTTPIVPEQLEESLYIEAHPLPPALSPDYDTRRINQ